MRKLKALVLGDAMIPGSDIVPAAKKYMGDIIGDLLGDSRTNAPSL